MIIKKIALSVVFFGATLTGRIFAQQVVLNSNDLDYSLAHISSSDLGKKGIVTIEMDTTVKTFDEPTFGKLRKLDFKDGTIEVKVKSKFIKNAPEWARGFIGIAFRIADDNSVFESIYIRPDNGRANDQIRRNRSTQYFAYPKHRFSDLRKSDPEKYESYADMQMDHWIEMKVVVSGASAKLYLNGNEQPSLIVNDLKHGPNNSGGIALWVGPGTEGSFKDLKITKKN